MLHPSPQRGKSSPHLMPFSPLPSRGMMYRVIHQGTAYRPFHAGEPCHHAKAPNRFIITCLPLQGRAERSRTTSRSVPPPASPVPSRINNPHQGHKPANQSLTFWSPIMYCSSLCQTPPTPSCRVGGQGSFCAVPAALPPEVVRCRGEGSTKEEGAAVPATAL